MTVGHHGALGFIAEWPQSVGRGLGAHALDQTDRTLLASGVSLIHVLKFCGTPAPFYLIA